MKKNLFVFALIAFIFASCAVGVKKDLTTGLKLSNTDLTFTEGYLSMDNAKLESNEFPLGKEVFIFISGAEGFDAAEGKVFVGASMTVTDEAGAKILDEADLFAQYTESGVSPEDVKSLSMKLTVAPPFEAGKKYLWKSKIWDKKGKGVIEAESEFIVK